MLPEKLLSYLLETAQDLLDTATYESQTHKAAVIVHWIAGLLESSAPEITPLLLAISDPVTHQALEEVTSEALLEIRLRLPDGSELFDTVLLVRR